MRASCIVLVATALAANGLAASATASTTWKTKVDRSSFRVTLDDEGVVNVVNKAMLAGQTMEVRDKMRIAVKQATGCDLVDELWFGAKLKGKLSCPAGQQPRPPERDSRG